MSNQRMPLHSVTVLGSRRVGMMYWDRVAGLSFTEIGRKYGVSRTRASQAFAQHRRLRREARIELETQIFQVAGMMLRWEDLTAGEIAWIKVALSEDGP